MTTVGVPTVVDAATMATDAIDAIIEKLIERTGKNSEMYTVLKQLDRDDKYQMINSILTDQNGNLVVTPKEVDTVIEDIAEIITNSLNVSLHSSIGIKDASKYH